MKWTNRTALWARWGWLITTLAMGIAVIGAAWANYRSARVAAEDLIWGEAHTLKDVVFRSHRPGDERRRADFDSLVVTQERRGLRYLAWVQTPATIVTSGGQPDPTPIAVPSQSSVNPKLVRLKSRVRVFFMPMRGPDRGPAPPRSAADSLHRAEPGPPPTLMMEFEPVVAMEMVARAERSLVAATVGALVLMTAGLGFWRLSERIEENERHMQEQRRLTTLGQMSAVLAHEIRNPLASLKGHAQLLVERLPNDSPERKRADRVVSEATRLELLTSDLLDFARAGRMDLKPVDPAAMLQAAAAQVPDAGVEVEHSRAPERWPLDQNRFEQAVLVNILQNAAQSSPPDRPPKARVEQENGTLVFTIRDYGPGLPEGEAERIFEPFFTTKTSGTGLGLAIARRVVELHGGKISAVNAAGGGASFRIEIPWMDA